MRICYQRGKRYIDTLIFGYPVSKCKISKYLDTGAGPKGHFNMPYLCNLVVRTAIWLNSSQPHQFSCLNFSSFGQRQSLGQEQVMFKLGQQALFFTTQEHCLALPTSFRPFSIRSFSNQNNFQLDHFPFRLFSIRIFSTGI